MTDFTYQYVCGIYETKVRCPGCGKIQTLYFTAADFQKLLEWKRGEIAHIQDAIPNYSTEQREMFISGMCKNCWNEMLAYTD